MARRKAKARDTNYFLVVISILVICWLFPRFALTLVILALVALIAFFLLRRYQSSNRRRKILQSGIKEIDVMQGIEFENYLCALFESKGFKVEPTPKTGDFGADLILRGNGRTIVVQAKRYHCTVGIDAVQAAHSSIPYYHAHEAMVITNQDFSTAARQLAQKSGVKLMSRQQLIDFIVQR